MTYFEYFHSVVMMGWICGLQHPIAWAIQADRVASQLDDVYREGNSRHISRFLVEFYEDSPREQPTTAGDVLDWINTYYPEKHINGYFDFLANDIAAYLQDRNRL